MKKILLITAGLLTAMNTSASRDVDVVTNDAYKKECSACHMAYQPGFLPARSWEKIFNNLHDHYGENAELGAEETKALKDYAMQNAADKSNFKRSKKIMKSLSGNETPLRIMDISYMKRKHDEVPDKLVKDNPKVKSLSRCEACHTKADSGSYSESEINIPGKGRWED